MMSNLIDRFQEYLLLEKKYSQHTASAYLRDVREFELFLSDQFNISTITLISYSEIRNWIVSLVESGLASNSVNRKIASLKSYYNYLLKIEEIKVSPLLKYRALKTTRRLQVPFSEIEVKNVLDQDVVSDDFEEIRNLLMIELFYVSGIRRNELIELKVSNLLLDQSAIKVVGKRNKERIIPLVKQFVKNITFYLDKRADLDGIKDLDYVFLTKKGVKLNNSLVYRVVNDYFSHASTKVKRSPHVMRHTYATHLLNNGADINSVKELLGHASLASTQIYTHVSMSELINVHRETFPRRKKEI